MQSRPWLAVLLVILGGLDSAAAAQDAGEAAGVDQALFVGRFLTCDAAQPTAEALAVVGGRIAQVYPTATLIRRTARRVRRVYLPGFIVPGLADAHIHVENIGEQLEQLKLQGMSKPSVIAAIRTAIQSAPGDAWILGGGWDEGFWQGAGFPTARELDAVSEGHPIILERIDGHSIWVNSRALELAGIGRDTPDPQGGTIRRDAQGNATGILIDNARDLVERVSPRPTHADRTRRIERALAQVSRWGLTSVHDAAVDYETIQIYRELLARGALTARVYTMVAGVEDQRRVLAEGPKPDLGQGLLAVRALKVFLDGALGSRGAELTEPYHDAPGNRGLERMSDIDLDRVIKNALAQGFQVAVHAIGDRAVHRALDAFERADVKPENRFRIEHASLVTDSDLPRFSELGIIASVQPVFVGEYSRWADDRVGPTRRQWILRIADLLKSGARIAVGTDYPDSDSGDPMMTLHCLVTRQSAAGTPLGGWHADQRIPIVEALPLLWTGAAYAAFEERDLGALSVGRYADFTVLSADPRSVPAEHVHTLKVLATVVGGRVVFSDTKDRFDGHHAR
jgi:predicted amidohydrolase YtcJ